MSARETKGFRNDVEIIILSVFFITMSLGVIFGINRLNKAMTPERPMAISAISSPAVAPSEVKATATTLSYEKVLPEKVVIPLTAKSRHGDGIEHTLIRQLRAKHKDKGLQWAQRRAHKFVVLAGLVGPGGEIRIKNGINIKKGVAYILDDDENQIITVFEGQEVRRTTIMKNLSHIQPVTPLPFEYVHHTPT